MLVEDVWGFVRANDCRVSFKGAMKTVWGQWRLIGQLGDCAG